MHVKLVDAALIKTAKRVKPALDLNAEVFVTVTQPVVWMHYASTLTTRRNVNVHQDFKGMSMCFAFALHFHVMSMLNVQTAKHVSKPDAKYGAALAMTAHWRKNV
jgi:hypothetical protein